VKALVMALVIGIENTFLAKKWLTYGQKTFFTLLTISISYERNLGWRFWALKNLKSKCLV